MDNPYDQFTGGDNPYDKFTAKDPAPAAPAPAAPAPDPSAGGGELEVWTPFGNVNTGIHTSQGVDRALSGYGKAITDLARGVGQDVGLVSRKDIEASRERDAPLMKTGAGKFGNVVGTAAALAPTLAIPGVNTVAGASALGLGLGAAMPSTSTKETLLNTGIGAVTGGLGQAGGNALARVAATRLAARPVAAAATQAENAERDAVLQQAREAGYVVPPTAVKPNAVNTAIESISGKAATRQKGMEINARVTNEGVRQDLGIAPHTPLTKAVLGGVRARAGKAYQAVKDELKDGFKSDGYYAQDLKAIEGSFADLESAYPGITKQANPQVKELIDAANVAEHRGPEAVELSKTLRSESKLNYKAAWGKGGDPSKLALSRAQASVADALENLIRRTLKDGGQEGLVDAWDAARTTIAKAHQAEAALKGGNVSATRLAQQMRGARYKPTGRMGLAAKFADHFEDVAKLPKSGAGVSKLSAAVAGLLSAKGLVERSPNLIAEGLTLGAGPYAARAAMLSRAGQRALATPSYRPGFMGTAALQGARAAGMGLEATKGGQPLLPSMYNTEPAFARGGSVSARLRRLKEAADRA